MEIKIEVEEETNNGIKRKYDQCSNEAYTYENQKEDLELMAKTDDEINEFIAREKNLRNMFDRLPDGGKRLIETLHRCKAELQRRNKFRSLQMGNEDDRSHDYRTETQNLVASNVEAPLAKRLSPRTTRKGPLHYAPWTDPKSTPCDALTDEKMQRIVNELVRVGVSEFDVGKAAEVCYDDPVKVKVLFALPSHMRKSYVCGFLHPPS